MAKSAAVNPSETPLDSDSLDALENPAIATEDSVPVAVAIDTDARRILAEKAVRRNAYWAAGVGAIPIPIVDFLGIGAIQLRMAKEISELYGVTFCENAARNIIGALVGTVGGGVLTRLTVVSLIKTLPFAGALIGGVVALPVIAGAATYALGRVFVRHYENGGDLLTLSPDRVKTYFKEQYDAGKKVVSNAVKRTTNGTTAVPAAAVASTPVDVKA